MTRKKSIILLLFIFFGFCRLPAQVVNTEKLPLTQVLKLLESRYNISFSFADETIKNKRLDLPKASLLLNEALLVLKNSTNLEYQILNDRFVVIKKPTKDGLYIQQLDEVYISKYLTSGISKTTTGTVTLSPKNFGILPGLIEPDVLQTIQALPGVLSIDESVSNLNIRGGTHDQNLILWDGIKMYQSGHFFGLISAYSPYLTKDVLVSKNGTSAIYGDGISGTIDMQLDNTVNNSSSGGAGFNLISADGYAKLPLRNNLELQISARRSITDIAKTPTYNQYFDRVFQDTDITNNQSNTNQTITTNEEFYFYDLSAKLIYDINKKDKLRLNFTNIFNTLDYLEEATTNTTNQALNSGLTQRNLASGISYNRKWNEAFSSDLQVYISNYKLNATNFDIINDQRLIQENEVLDTGIKLHANYTINPNLKWANGYQFFEIGITNLRDVNNPLFRSKIKNVLRSHSVYSEATLVSNNKNTHLKAGIRGNYFSAFSKLILEPRLSFSQQFLGNFKVEILGEFKSQTTSQIIDRQNDFLGIEKRRWELANNTTVPIIKSKQASVGLHYKEKSLLISTEAYVKTVNGITTRNQGFQNQYQFVEAIGGYDVKGIDFLINKQYNNVSTWLSYSLSKNDYTFDGLNSGESFPNNTDIRHAVTFAGTYNINNLKLALGINWHSGKANTNPVEGGEVATSNINYQLPNSNNLDDYFRTDFSSTYQFNLGKTTKAKVGLSVWNAFNKKNTLNTYYTLESDNTISKIETKSLGITPNLSFRVNF